MKNLSISILQNAIGYGLSQRKAKWQKNEDTWCGVLVRSRRRIRYSPKSIRWAVFWTIRRIVLRNPDGNLNVAYLNWNGGRWKLNFNWLDNEWNDNDRLARRHSLHSLA